MKAAIALLSDHHVQNVARKMAYEISQRAPVDFLGSLLSAHPLFFYTDGAIEPGSFICYKVLPLTG